MRFNPDCVRDILFLVEERTDGEVRIGLPSQAGKLRERYTDAEILYHAKQCNESGFFRKTNIYMDGEIWIGDLSPKGHEFIASIRDNTFWRKAKSAAPGAIGKLLEIVLPSIFK